MSASERAGPTYAVPPWLRQAGQRSTPLRPRRQYFLPALVGVIQVLGASVASPDHSSPDPVTGWGYALLLIGPAALLLRHRWPLLTFAVALVAATTYLTFDFPGGPAYLAALVALVVLFRVAPRPTRRLAAGMCAAAYLLYVYATMSYGQHAFIDGVAIDTPSLSRYLTIAAWTTVALVVAEFNRVRGEHFAEMGRARVEANRARQEQQRRQASEERLRIAGELHDVLGHHLSLINVRAGIALHLLDSQPEQAREALGAIKQASAEALREVRGVLASLRPDEPPPRTPTPDLTNVEDLVAAAVAAGLPVEYRVHGTPGPVPAEMGRAAYRIVQEALTNVRRHAGPSATATVELTYAAHRIQIQVDDTGAGGPGDGGAGNGIPGMRARAEALGGTFHAGARPGGGFTVTATLPRDVSALTKESA